MEKKGQVLLSVFFQGMPKVENNKGDGGTS